jgi:hypothetical protein
MVVTRDPIPTKAEEEEQQTSASVRGESAQALTPASPASEKPRRVDTTTRSRENALSTRLPCKESEPNRLLRSKSSGLEIATGKSRKRAREDEDDDPGFPVKRLAASLAPSAACDAPTTTNVVNDDTSTGRRSFLANVSVSVSDQNIDCLKALEQNVPENYDYSFEEFSLNDRPMCFEGNRFEYRYDGMFFCMQRNYRADLKNYLISLGLSFLNRLFEARGKEQMRMRVENSQLTHEEFLRDALKRSQDQVQNSKRELSLQSRSKKQRSIAWLKEVRKAFPQINSRKQEFIDTLDKSNKAWNWNDIRAEPRPSWESNSIKGLRI